MPHFLRFSFDSPSYVIWYTSNNSMHCMLVLIDTTTKLKIFTPNCNISTDSGYNTKDLLLRIYSSSFSNQMIGLLLWHCMPFNYIELDSEFFMPYIIVENKGTWTAAWEKKCQCNSSDKRQKKRLLNRLHCPLVNKTICSKVTNEKAIIYYFFPPFFFFLITMKMYEWLNKKANLSMMLKWILSFDRVMNDSLKLGCYVHIKTMFNQKQSLGEKKKKKI